MKTFAKGVHPPAYKQLSENCDIVEMKPPEVLAIALSQHIGVPAQEIVAVGDNVKKGQLIGKACEGKLSANVFCSVSGIVTAIEDRFGANGQKCRHIIIKNDFKEEEDYLPKLNNPSKEQILERLHACGIVGMGGAGFPTAVKLAPRTPVDTLIINGAECEPFITCDYRIMRDYTQRLFSGISLLAQALGLQTAYIGVEVNKPEAIAKLQEQAHKFTDTKIVVEELKVKYPQGAERQLIYAITKRKVPAGGLPSDVGVIVCNVHTALSSYYAVCEGQPCFTRVMTVTGGAITTPSNLWVRNGTSFDDIIEFCGGEKQDNECVRLINGGPMMGKPLANGKVAATKTTSCVLLLSQQEVKTYEILPCINCSKCATACPMKLMPMYIDRDYLVGDLDGCQKFGAEHCIECGCCTYVCPSKRPLVQSIGVAKRQLKERANSGRAK